jgi:outer membrane lipoprotein SlyB
MILIKKLTVIVCFLSVTACSSINSANVETLRIENGVLYNGKIIKVEKTQLNANFTKRASGSLIGHFIAKGLGANGALQFASALVGSTIANKEYGQYVDLIEVQSTQGQRYKTYVPVDYFSLNQKVNFKAEKLTINSIARVKG